MIELTEKTRVFLFTGPTDMRRGHDRLSEMVREQTKHSPLEGGLFVFFSRRRDKVKLLYWDRDGYVIIYKRLEAGTFRVEERDGTEEVTGVDLKLLLDGMSLSRIKLRRQSAEGVFNSEAA